MYNGIKGFTNLLLFIYCCHQTLISYLLKLRSAEFVTRLVKIIFHSSPYLPDVLKIKIFFKSHAKLNLQAGFYLKVR